MTAESKVMYRLLSVSVAICALTMVFDLWFGLGLLSGVALMVPVVWFADRHAQHRDDVVINDRKAS